MLFCYVIFFELKFFTAFSNSLLFFLFRSLSVSASNPLYPKVRILHACIRVSSLAFFKDQERPLIRLAYMCQFNILPGLFLDTKFRNFIKVPQNRLSFDYPGTFQPTRPVNIVKLFNVRENETIRLSLFLNDSGPVCMEKTCPG